MNDTTVFIYKNSIGSITFQKSSQFWITDIDGVSGVDIDLTDSRAPDQIGSTVTAQSVQPRDITIDGCIFDPVEWGRQRLIDIISPQTSATLTYKQGTESWYLDVIPKKTPEIAPGVGVQEFQLNLRAAYPYWRTLTSKSTHLSGLKAMFKFPFYTGGTWYISENNGNYFTTITNSGNVPVEIKVTFGARAEIENPEIYHVGTGKRIALKKTFATGEKAFISTVYGEKGVTITDASGNTSNGFKYLTTDSDMSMTLLPGSNLFRSDATNRDALIAIIEAPEGVRSGV